ncbi:MAG: DNA polymerase III subunit delta [Oscillospiraceae bacterium]|nr:DNA polymerase III subunit delta [Oscillospiraceae bacterium]
MAKKESSSDSISVIREDLKSGKPANAYIFYGEEGYLKDYYYNQLRSSIIDPLSEFFNFHRFDEKSFTTEALIQAVNAVPVMAERSLIRIDDIDLSGLNESARTAVTDILNDLPEYVCLVFYYDIKEYKPDKRYKKLYEAISKNCKELEFPKQSQASVTEWCIRHFRSAGKTISKDLCAYLIFLTGGTLSALNSEIEKISAYAAGDQITKEDIDAVTIPVLDAQVFDITDAIAAKRFSLAIEKLGTILQLMEDPFSIAGAISSNLRRLYAAKTVLEAGKGRDELKAICGITDYFADKMLSTARGFSMEFCEKAVLLCAQTDYQIKTSYDDPQALLQLLIVSLSQEATA